MSGGLLARIVAVSQSFSLIDGEQANFLTLEFGNGHQIRAVISDEAVAEVLKEVADDTGVEDVEVMDCADDEYTVQDEIVEDEDDGLEHPHVARGASLTPAPGRYLGSSFGEGIGFVTDDGVEQV